MTNIRAGDHLGLNYITTVEELAVLKRVIVMNVAEGLSPFSMRPTPSWLPWRPSAPGQVIFFARDFHHPVITAHRAQGKRTVSVDGDCIVAAEGSWRESIPLRDVPLTRNGTIGFRVENVMASVAAAWAAGIDWDSIRNGVASFVNDADNAPGRFNVMDFKGRHGHCRLWSQPRRHACAGFRSRRHARQAPFGGHQRGGRPSRRRHP